MRDGALATPGRRRRRTPKQAGFVLLVASVMLPACSALGSAPSGAATAEPAPSVTASAAASASTPAAAAARPAETVDSIRVMSFNVRQADITAEGAHHPDPVEFQWPTSRGPAVVREVKRAGADIVAFQEVKHHLKGPDGRRIPGDMITALADGLPDYTFTKVTERKNYLPIAFRTTMFRLIRSGRVQIQYVSDPNSDSNRFFAWAVLERRSDHQRLMVVNVWANDGGTRQMALGRAQGWSRLLPAVSDLTHGYALPTILLGDFNSHASATTFPFNAHLTAFRGDGWTDASLAPTNLQVLAGVSSYNAWGRHVNGTFYPKAIRYGERIDYIWTKGGAVPLTWQIFLPPISYRRIDGELIAFGAGPFPSDHWPVVSDIALGAAPTTAGTANR